MKRIIKRHRYLWRRFPAYRAIVTIFPFLTALSLCELAINGTHSSLLVEITEILLFVMLLSEQVRTRTVRYMFRLTLHHHKTYVKHHEDYVRLTSAIEERNITSKKELQEEVMRLRIENHNLSEQISMLQAK